jgi:RecQ family ATP-dependent DNA helicase
MSETRFPTRTAAINTETLMRGYSRLPEVLKSMGYSELRGGQQEPIVNILGQRDAIVILPTGCHAAGTRILMYDGSVRKVEDVSVGDFLMGPDSTPRMVQELCRGIGPMRKVIPNKGAPFVCNSEHVLSLKRTGDKSKHTGEISDVRICDWEHWNKTKKHTHKLFRTGVTFPEQAECNIDPYFLGLFLGDGSGCAPESSIRIHSLDAEIETFLRFFAKGYGLNCKPCFDGDGLDGYTLTPTKGKPNPVQRTLRALGLSGCDAGSKFIPKKFLTSSRQERLRLLAGLIDSDGSLGNVINSGSGYDYVSKSAQLTDDVAFLARSLGYAAYPARCVKKSQNGTEGIYHRLWISGNDFSDLPCLVSRKKAKSRKKQKDVCVTGFRIEKLSDDQYYGFVIDGDSRYLLGDFTVTHNTGKTAVFVVPTLCLDWCTLVFSPLVALMRDQVQGLWRMGIRAGAMSSTQTEAENMLAVRQWMAGELQLFYVAPERLQNAIFKEAIRSRRPDMVVLDEAHTLSQWSDNFRPAYCAVGDFIAEHNPKVVTAFTATAPEEVEVDIRRVLGLQQATKHIHYPRRSNLKLTSRNYVDLMDMVGTINSINGPTIVYCATVEKGVERIADQLSQQLEREVTMYHGQLTPEAKRTNQDLFMNDYAPVIVATNAFGMGIDKPNIRGVIHYNFPGSIEALAQETGRAGRDGKDSICVTYNSEESLRTQQFFIESAYPPRGDVEAVFSALERTQDMEGISYLTGDEIAKESGISTFKLRSVMSILIGNNVVARTKASEKIARVNFSGNSEDPKFQKWKATILKGGSEETDGFVEFDLNWLISEVSLGQATVSKYLRDWDKAGLIRYVAPFRGAPSQIIGKIDLIDFDRLRQKSIDARRKLDDLLRYFDIPDADKHAYIEEYFQVHR